MPTDDISRLPAPAIVVEFHYKPKGAARPYDETENTDRLEWASGSFVPIPAIDDTVSYDSWEHTGPGPTDGRDCVVMRKVVSRHFYTHQDHVCVYVVVTDLSDAERASRLKE